VYENQEVAKTKKGVVCRSCFQTLKHEYSRRVRAQSEDINYPMAVMGGLLGGAVGAVVWWGFTVITHVSFGLIAVVIGFAVGYGVVKFAGDKRARALQGISGAIAAGAFCYALFLVNRTLILRNTRDIEIPLFPDPEIFIEVIKAGFDVFDLVFLGIVVYQAWKMPAPLKLEP
jgi:hypothetical protein